MKVCVVRLSTLILINLTWGCTISAVATLMYSEKKHKILKYSNVRSYCILLPIDLYIIEFIMYTNIFLFFFCF